MSELGRVGIIANPAAQNGNAAQIAKHAAGKICDSLSDVECKLHLTERPKHAIEMAREMHDRFDTVIVIGGDGIVHETANGLMHVPEDLRPKMGVIPVGSGNDYALTLGMSNHLDEAVSQILACKTKMMDVGNVNGTYFVETLSFGLDAAIANETVERRKRTGQKGALLYMSSGIDQIMHHLDANRFTATFYGIPGRPDDEPLVTTSESYIFAVQIGKTYGGHFEVCPNANPQDGLFDICIAHPPMNALKAVSIFMLAKGGHHTKFKNFEFLRASSIKVEFTEPPEAQTDGEKLIGESFDVTMLPRSLEVICGR